MGKFDKQLKYSIRKVSVGAASVVIGAFYLAMGAGVVHAETNTTNTDGGASHSSPSPDPETSRPNGLTSSSYGAVAAQNPGGLQAGAVHSVKEDTKTITRTIKYVDASDESKEVSATVTQTVTLTRKQGTEEWTTGKWEAQTSPTVNGFGAPDKSTIESKEVTSSTESEEVLVYYSQKGSATSNSETKPNTRGRRSKRDLREPSDSNTSTGTETNAGASTENNEALNSALTERKGSTVQPDQPGISIPTGDEPGAHDPNAHISFDDPGHTATVEEMWKIIQHMPDDFQNNERSYLRNMDTLGRELRFDKTAENPEGVPLKPGEIRELHDFGGWHAIDKDGTQGKFVIGRKNEQGYFTGWHKVGKTSEGIPIMEQGGMLGADALDNIYVHEQALDRRFDYMLMLVKGRTRANRTETVADHSTYDPRTPNERSNLSNTEFNKLPFLEKDKFNKYSPGVVGYNGLEKKFTAFSTKYGSRVRVDFVTGYITDINGSKGSYRVVIKAQNSKGEETQVYDETISRVAEIVQNEELYKKGLNVEAAHANILKFLKDEFNYRVNKIKNPKVKANSLLRGTKEKDYTPEQQKVYDQIVEEATEEAKKQGDIVMNVTEDFLSITKAGKKDSEWKKTFTNTAQSTAKLSNDLNNLLKNADKDTPNTPTWLSSGSSQAKADDRAYRLLTTLIPGAKKITYHVNDDQLEVETDKYTYTAARNGSKEVGIQGSNIAATLSADAYGANPQTFDRENTNTKANNLNHGWATSSSEEFKHFSRFLGVDKGIVRTNVISDEELSAKIKEAVGPGYSKLGKAGYFSTADIPLGPDIVSYTVQVIPSDNERVGVNPQSSRIQYNMPILADFSVIQDTTGPSKELARRIIGKSNLPEDKKREILKKIEESKKTSELRVAMSGNVKVRYVDKAGNVITNIENEKTFGEKDSENRYTAAKDVLINSTYDVTARAYRTLSTTNNKYYSLIADNGGLAAGSASTTGTIDTTNEDKVVTFVYELTEKPVTPTTGKGVVHFKKQVSETTTEALTGYDDITLSGNVGETFSSTEVDTKITELKNAGYEIVTNEFDTNSKTIDSTADVDGQDPSQVYNVVVREKVEIVTTPPTPNTPVDPNVPEGPKWPAEGLKESDLTKEVTRTINYFKKETADGEKIADAQPTKVDKVLYKRTATYNLVRKTVTYSGWTATADDTHTATSFSPVKTPVLAGYVADFKEVTDAPAAPNENGEVTNMTKEVVYTKLGSWVPKIPGKTSTPIPYPNDPNDATKPKYPDYPTTPENPDGTPVNPGGETPGTPEKPKTPVIPYVEGYVPKIPTDPTTPVGEDNPLKPLVPIDSNDPKKGYKVPELPNDPKKDTVIEYKPNPQKILIKVVNVTTGEEVELPNEKLEFNGVSDQVVTSEDKGKVDKKIDSLQKRGYIVSTKNPITETTKYDTKDDSNQKEPTQTYKIIVNEPVTKDTEVRKVTRTIKYVKIDVQDGNEVRTELNTEKIKTKVDKVEFSRDTTTSLATGLTKIGAWDQETKELPKVNTPVLVGYIANVVSVENKSVSPDTESYEVTVEYRKIGSWVPRLPEGVKPPTGTDMTPKPYPNHPTDPTTPGTPVYPEPGQPITPGTPVIPYVPGYTPKTPDGNPLVPVDPEHPENGYKVPPVPTTSGTNTDITYVADPQKALVKVVKVDGTTETPLTEDNVAIAGKTGEKIPDDSVTAKIADLEKRGYIVDNKQDVLIAIAKDPFDKAKDTDGEDPTQIFTLKVHEKLVPVTPPTEDKPITPGTPIDPDTPVDPNNPNDPIIPRWTKDLIKKLDVKKEVTRTINYVDEAEHKVSEPSTDKVTFTREAKINVVTGEITYGDWKAVDGDDTFDKVSSPVVKGYILKDANQKEVASATVKSDAKNETITVVYTKVGSYVPKVPEGVTPPSPTPYDNDPQDPSKVVTPNPEKPQDPNDPNSPKVPVLPQVPGHTPVIPKDPTKPVSPENPLVPLTPVDPNHPEKGYNVPPVPTTPGQDTPIEYVKEGKQRAITNFVDGSNNNAPIAPPVIDQGDSNTPLTKDGDVATTIAKLKLKGYDVETNTYPPKGTFDNDPKVDQYFKVTLTPRVKPVKPFDPTNPKDPNKPVPGQPIDPDTPVDPNNPNDPTIPRWTEDLIKKLDVKKEVTRTINYVDEAEHKVSEPSTDKVTFTREAKINVVTGEITYGDWKAKDNDTTFAEVISPVVKGYILKANQGSEDGLVTVGGTRVVASENLTATSENQNVNVVYTKLGSWVLTPPTGVTPPEGTNFDPKPYPNHPTDPTRPGEPTDPNVPVIPYVPGYTPKTPDGNPLVPVDPNDPTKGYIPPVPTEPGKDTPIEYVKVPNTPSPEEPEKPTPESNHITIWVDENGKPLKPEKPGTHEPGNIPGYRYITTVTKDGVTIHKFEKITPVDPYNPVPQKPTTPIPTPNTPEANTPTSETNRREELPNTGTEANAGLASAGIMTLLAGLGLGVFKKKEEDEK